MFCIVLYFGHKLIKRPSFVKAAEMDFVTGTLKYDPMSIKEGESLDDDIPLWKRILNKLVNIIA